MITRGFPNIAQVQAAMNSIYRHFGWADLNRYSEGIHQHLGVPTAWSDPVIESQRWARLISLRYGLLVGTVIVTFVPNLGNAGKVELTPATDLFVEIDAVHSEDPAAITAILAHEVTHIFLYRRGLGLVADRDNEILTDTTAVYLGLGVLLLSAYKSRSQGFDLDGYGGVRAKSEIRHFGYLTPDECGYLLAKRHLAFGDDPRPFLTDDLAREALDSGQARTELEFRQAPLSSASMLAKLQYIWARRLASRAAPGQRLDGCPVDRRFGFQLNRGELCVVFPCPVCRQKLRLPCHRRKAAVRCPVCAQQLACTT